MKKLISAMLLIAAAGTAYAQMPTPDQVMADNDTNKDGVITKEEATAAGTPLTSFFDQWDANHDGKLTAAEVSAALGGAAPAMPAGGAPAGAPPTGK